MRSIGALVEKEQAVGIRQFTQSGRIVAGQLLHLRLVANLGQIIALHQSDGGVGREHGARGRPRDIARRRAPLLVRSNVTTPLASLRPAAFKFDELLLNAAGARGVLTALKFAGGAALGGVAVAQALQLLGQ